MIKLGVNVWSYPKTLNVIDAIKHAAKVGYNGFEPAITIDDIESFNSSEFNSKWKRVYEEAQSAGIEIPSIATGLFWKYNLVIEDQLDKALKVVEAEARAARIVNAKVILVVPCVGVSQIKYSEHYDRVLEAMKRIEVIARDNGVMVGLENVWNKFFAGPLEMKKLLDQLDPKVFGLYLDVGNTLPHSLPEHWIDVLGDRIVQIHAKDFSVSELRFGIPLNGDVNWKAIRDRLKEINYKGYIVAEVPPYPGDPYKASYDAYTSLKRIFYGEE